MLMRLFLGLTLILCFLVIYPSMMSILTDNVSGLLTLIPAGSMSPLEQSIWGLFPLAFLVLGVGGFIWLIVRDRER